MPFGFLKRRRDEPAPDAGAHAAAAPGTAEVHGVEFEALTVDWRLRGVMEIAGRMSDALNRREAITIADVSWGPPDGSAPLEPAPGLQSVDPYDLILVVAGPGSLPPMSEAEQNAHKVHKVSYDVALEVPPYRVIGTVHLYPGAEPGRLLDRATEMFVAVTDAVASMGETRITDPDDDVILVNRFYLRGVAQVDKRTGERHQPLPGAPLGGVSWQDRSR